MRQFSISPDSDLADSLEDFRRARIRRAAAEDIERQLLDRVLQDATFHHDHPGAPINELSLRQLESLTGISRPTLARKRLTDTFGTQPAGPSDYYDEDEWIAAEDAAYGNDPAMQDDRGPWRVSHNEDGTRTYTRLNIGTARLKDPQRREPEPSPDTTATDPAYEPPKSITLTEYEHIKDSPEGERSERIIRRLSRAVLRTLHPGMPRTGIILEAAIEAVKQDLPGAMVLIDEAIPHDTADEDWIEDLRTRQARGFYLPRWDQGPLLSAGASDE